MVWRCTNAIAQVHLFSSSPTAPLIEDLMPNPYASLVPQDIWELRQFVHLISPKED